MNLKHLLCFFPILFVNGFIFVPDKIKLKFLRQNIDFIDDKIYNLLDLRYKIVKEVGQQKRVVYDRDRETSILNRLKAGARFLFGLALSLQKAYTSYVVP